MLRATMTRPGKGEFVEVPKPSFGPEDVLLRIRRIGIRGSDVHVYHGKHPHTSYQIVQGHEFCGDVAEIGRNVHSFGPGDLVTAAPETSPGSACWSGVWCRPASWLRSWRGGVGPGKSWSPT
jgi:L-iditol 2-dehydrogenase